MEAKELRIGNWVQTAVGFNEVAKLSDGLITVQLNPVASLSHSKNLTNGFEPIPLTEEWLLKAGAVQPESSYKIGRFDIYFDRTSNGWIVSDSYFGFYYATIQYVHELQNLVFALDKTELTFQ